MSSYYESFDVTKRNADGTSTAIDGATVKVYNADTGAAITPDLTANSAGVVVAGTLAVAAGTRIRFRIENYQGLAGSLTQITT